MPGLSSKKSRKKSDAKANEASVAASKSKKDAKSSEISLTDEADGDESSLQAAALDGLNDTLPLISVDKTLVFRNVAAGGSVTQLARFVPLVRFLIFKSTTYIKRDSLFDSSLYIIFSFLS